MIFTEKSNLNKIERLECEAFKSWGGVRRHLHCTKIDNFFVISFKFCSLSAMMPVKTELPQRPTHLCSGARRSFFCRMRCSSRAYDNSPGIKSEKESDMDMVHRKKKTGMQLLSHSSYKIAIKISIYSCKLYNTFYLRRCYIRVNWWDDKIMKLKSSSKSMNNFFCSE